MNMPRRVNTALCQMALLLLCPLPQRAGASTEAEDERHKAPMPHELYGSHGDMVKVHLVSARSYVVGRPPNDNAGILSQMRAEVADCVRHHNEHGIASNPPRVWPEHHISDRKDTYSSINRTIIYHSGLGYGVNQLDCSLLESRTHTARLSSSRGSCVIDLRAKTAHGFCDATAHASAKPPTRMPGLSTAQIAAIERDAPHNPAMAAFAAAVRSHPPSGTGERKTILGLGCDVSKNPFDPDGKICLSRGGSLTSSIVTGDLKHSGLLLEGTTVAGIKLWATQVQLDAMVNGAVFAPYLAGGFQIDHRGARP